MEVWLLRMKELQEIFFYIFINEMLDIDEKRDDYRLAQLSLRSSEVSHKFLPN